jgi:hypothetical protein
LIAGERYAPQRFLGTPLETLIPVRIDPEFLGHYETTLTTGFRPVQTPEGRSHRLFPTATKEEHAESWFDSLPELYWIARSYGPMPGATVLVRHPALRTRGDADEAPQPMPLLVLGRYGAGRILFQATDETWRWRRYRSGDTPAGEWLHDTYWVQVVRTLAPARRTVRDQEYTIRTDRRVYRFGDRVRIEVEVLDAAWLNRVTDSMALLLAEQIEVPEGEQEDSVAVQRCEAIRRSPDSRLFEAVLVPPRPGRYQIRLDQPPPNIGNRLNSAAIRVEAPEMERRRPEADHDALAQIADMTGGQVVELNELSSVFSGIRSRSIQIPDDIVEPLWDSKLALIFFTLIISTEWILRKAYGLQ